MWRYLEKIAAGLPLLALVITALTIVFDQQVRDNVVDGLSSWVASDPTMLAVLAVLSVIPGWMWWLLAVFCTHSWSIELCMDGIRRPERPRLFKWITAALCSVCLCLALAYSSWWMYGAAYFGFVIWKRNQYDREDRQRRSV
jgi:hypothetical protein